MISNKHYWNTALLLKNKNAKLQYPQRCRNWRKGILSPPRQQNRPDKIKTWYYSFCYSNEFKIIILTLKPGNYTQKS